VRSYLESGNVGELGLSRATGEWYGEPKTHVHNSTANVARIFALRNSQIFEVAFFVVCVQM